MAETAMHVQRMGAPVRETLPRLTPYQWMCHHLVLRSSDIALRQRVSARFRELLSRQWDSPERIAEYQRIRLRALLSLAASRVPLYREHFRQLRIQPADVSGPEHLHVLPIVERGLLRERFNDLRLEGYRGRTYEMKSSGSTGMQATVLLDRACLSETLATQLLFWSWGGFAMGKPHLQTGMSLNRGVVKRVKDLVFRCTYTSAFDLTDAKLETVARQIERKRIRVLFGYASSLYVIARFFERRGIQSPMEAIFSWGDSLFPHYRELIERVFQCAVNDCYGLGEGMQCAAQCEEHGPLHEAMHGVVLEVVDQAGRPCPPGELGRVLVTRLEPGPQPLIRYDTGDVAYAVSEPCGCGRALRALSRVQGRATDIVTTPAGDRLIVHFFTQLFEMLPEIAQFQVNQEIAEAIKIRFVPGSGFRPEVLETVRRQILAECKFPLGITFEQVGEIGLAKSNKRRFVISTVPF